MRAHEITEAFDTQAVKWNEKGQDVWVAAKQFGEHTIECELCRDIPMSHRQTKLPWTFNFSSRKDKGVAINAPTHEARSKNMQILGYVVSCLREFINQAEPIEVVFKGNRSNGLAALYKAMVRYLRPQLSEIGYNIIEIEPGSFSIRPQWKI